MYYVLDGDDITKILAYKSGEQLIKEYGLTNKEFGRISGDGEKYENKYFIFDEPIHKREKPADDVMFYRNPKNDNEFYVTNNGEFYFIDKTKNGKVIKLKVQDNGSTTFIMANGKYFTAGRVVYESFSGEKIDLKKNFINYKNGNRKDLRFSNIEIHPRTKFLKKNTVQSPRLRIGLYENGKLKKVYIGYKEVEKNLFISRYYIYDILEKKVKNPMYDLRRIKSYGRGKVRKDN
jgi:hypothetical protein